MNTLTRLPGWAAPVAIAVIAASAAAPVASAAPTVPTVVAQASAVGVGLEIDGTLQAVRQSTVAAQVSGNIVQLRVRAGDAVRAGQVLARIDERDAQAGLCGVERRLADEPLRAQLTTALVVRECVGRFGLRLRDRGFAARQTRLCVALVDACQHLTGTHRVAGTHPQLDDVARYLCRHRALPHRLQGPVDLESDADRAGLRDDRRHRRRRRNHRRGGGRRHHRNGD